MCTLIDQSAMVYCGGKPMETCQKHHNVYIMRILYKLYI